MSGTDGSYQPVNLIKNTANQAGIKIEDITQYISKNNIKG
jgi:hypothetical protein